MFKWAAYPHGVTCLVGISDIAACLADIIHQMHTCLSTVPRGLRLARQAKLNHKSGVHSWVQDFTNIGKLQVDSFFCPIKSASLDMALLTRPWSTKCLLTSGLFFVFLSRFDIFRAKMSCRELTQVVSQQTLPYILVNIGVAIYRPTYWSEETRATHMCTHVRIMRGTKPRGEQL